MNQNNKNYGKWKKKKPYYRKKNKKRNKVEMFLDRYNHIMEFIRTLLGLTAVVLQIYIILKLL